MTANTSNTGGVSLARIPGALKSLPNWTVYRLAPNGSRKPKKVPYNPATSTKASPTDPSTWASFAAALDTLPRFDGLNFNPDGSGLIGVDIDNCRDPETGHIRPEAEAIVARIRSYWETSPSGTGLRAFLKGSLPEGHKNRTTLAPSGIDPDKKVELELYSTKHFLSVTGHHIEGTPSDIEECSQEMTALYNELFPPKPKESNTQTQGSGCPTPADEEILGRLRAEGNGKFAALWEGELSDYAGDASRADLALASKIAFYSQDPEQIERIMRQSKLRRPKWRLHKSYLRDTIRKAIEGLTARYDGPPPFAEQWEAEQEQQTKERFYAPEEPRIEIIEGLLSEKELTVVAGFPNVGKTPMLTDTVFRLIYGLDWYGRKVSKRPVISFDLETDGFIYRRNLRRLAERFNQPMPSVPAELEPYWMKDDMGRNEFVPRLLKAMGSPKYREAVLELMNESLQRKPNAVVIIDPPDLLFQLEMSKQDVMWLYTQMKRLLAKYPHAAFILVFNLRKTDRQAKKRPDLLGEPRMWLQEVSGHGDIINRSDVRLGMDYHPSGEEVRVINGIRRGEPIAPMLLEEHVLFAGEPAGFDAKTADYNDVKAVLSEIQYDYYQQLKAKGRLTFSQAAGIVPKGSLSRLLGKLKSLGWCHQVGDVYQF